jgi:hypothetical protein
MNIGKEPFKCGMESVECASILFPSSPSFVREPVRPVAFVAFGMRMAGRVNPCAPVLANG